VMSMEKPRWARKRLWWAWKNHDERENDYDEHGKTTMSGSTTTMSMESCRLRLR